MKTLITIIIIAAVADWMLFSCAKDATEPNYIAECSGCGIITQTWTADIHRYYLRVDTACGEIDTLSDWIGCEPFYHVGEVWCKLEPLDTNYFDCK